MRGIHQLRVMRACTMQLYQRFIARYRRLFGYFGDSGPDIGDIFDISAILNQISANCHKEKAHRTGGLMIRFYSFYGLLLFL